MDPKIKYLPIVFACILILIGILGFSGNIGLMGNFILLGFMVGMIPYLLLSYFELQWIRAIEEQMPLFLLDLAESQKTGMTLPDSLKLIAKTDYGRLSPEIKNINDQISWGIPVQECLTRFSNRLKKSKLVTRVTRIIVESYNSGGEIARTMESIAADIITIREAEKERKAMAYQQVVIMYAIYFIFVGIIIGLSKTLIPMIQLNVETSAIGGILTFQDPCLVCAGSSHIFCITCNLFSVVCQMFALGGGAKCYYYALFLMMTIVQGIFSGLVAGQIGENSVVAGFKHSAIMTFTGFGLLMILLQVGVL